MNEALIKQIAALLAGRVNQAVDIAFVSEEDEQKFYELVVLILLRLILDLIGLRGDGEVASPVLQIPDTYLIDLKESQLLQSN